jgi:TonB family protein
MIGDHVLPNLASYSIQVACIVALGTMLYYALRIDVPWLRHAYWRGVLAVCLLMPLMEGREPVQPAASGSQLATAAPVVLTVSMRTGSVSSSEPVDWTRIAAMTIVAGVGFRLLWTAMGLWQLRQLRRAGIAAAPDEHADLQCLLGTRAEIRYVSAQDQPVTFGALRPVVVLPGSLRDHPVEIQRAVVCHELCHVRRRDWAWALMEEATRAALWFHPGVWWLISRIQLTREEVVDAEVVRATGERRMYLEALMAFADAAPLTPAAAFSRRRHLFRRMLLISQEAVMSSKRVLVSCVASAIVIVAGSWYAVSAFPMQGAPVGTAPRPGQIVPPPPQADERGPVERRAKPITPENPVPRRTYSVPVEPPAGAAPIPRAIVLRLTLDESGRVAEARHVGRSAFNGVPEYVKGAIDAVKQWRYDPPADGPISFDVSINFQGPATPDIAFRGSPPDPNAPVRVGGGVLLPRKIKHVTPEYPEIAKDARVQGVVITEVVVEADGAVGDVRILRSIPLLDAAAVAAVRQWQFEPTLLNGTAVPVVMTATVQFSLADDQPPQ